MKNLFDISWINVFFFSPFCFRFFGSLLSSFLCFFFFFEFITKDLCIYCMYIHTYTHKTFMPIFHPSINFSKPSNGPFSFPVPFSSFFSSLAIYFSCFIHCISSPDSVVFGPPLSFLRFMKAGRNTFVIRSRLDAWTEV